MCTVDKDGYTWIEVISPHLRPAWKLVVPDFDTSVAVIFDYRPGEPPFKLHMVLPYKEPEWHYSLDEAKQSAVVHFVGWRLLGN